MEKWKNVRKEILSNSKVAKEYDKLTSVDIAAQIINAREKKGITQSELADMAGTSQSAIARLESGRHCGCSIRTLVKIARALGFTLKVSLQPAL
ncbi:MAG: helix-turn-helix transcriptional regulator [Armatimonadota bacterium]